MPHNFITLPRSELYNLVWSKPVTELAKDFGISDVALARRCRALNIPLPWRGYWAKVAAGQSPRRTPLRPFRDPRNRTRAKRLRGAPSARERLQAASPSSLPSYVTTRDAIGPLPEPAITFEPRPEPAAAKPTKPHSPQEAALRARIDALELTPLATLVSAHPAVLRTAQSLKRPWRKEITFPRGTRHGPVLFVDDVSEPQQDRALTVFDGLLRAARRALGPRTLTVDLQGAPTDFLSWAERYVNQLDPLHPDARNPDLQHAASPYSYGTDEKRPQQELECLLGHTWQHAAKLV